MSSFALQETDKVSLIRLSPTPTSKKTSPNNPHSLEPQLHSLEKNRDKNDEECSSKLYTETHEQPSALESTLAKLKISSILQNGASKKKNQEGTTSNHKNVEPEVPAANKSTLRKPKPQKYSAQWWLSCFGICRNCCQCLEKKQQAEEQQVLLNSQILSEANQINSITAVTSSLKLQKYHEIPKKKVKEIQYLLSHAEREKNQEILSLAVQFRFEAAKYYAYFQCFFQAQMHLQKLLAKPELLGKNHFSQTNLRLYHFFILYCYNTQRLANRRQKMVTLAFKTPQDHPETVQQQYQSLERSIEGTGDQGFLQEIPIIKELRRLIDSTANEKLLLSQIKETFTKLKKKVKIDLKTLPIKYNSLKNKFIKAAIEQAKIIDKYQGLQQLIEDGEKDMVQILKNYSLVQKIVGCPDNEQRKEMLLLARTMVSQYINQFTSALDQTIGQELKRKRWQSWSSRLDKLIKSVQIFLNTLKPERLVLSFIKDVESSSLKIKAVPNQAHTSFFLRGEYEEAAVLARSALKSPSALSKSRTIQGFMDDDNDENIDFSPSFCFEEEGVGQFQLNYHEMTTEKHSNYYLPFLNLKAFFIEASTHKNWMGIYKNKNFIRINKQNQNKKIWKCCLGISIQIEPQHFSSQYQQSPQYQFQIPRKRKQLDSGQLCLDSIQINFPNDAKENEGKELPNNFKSHQQELKVELRPISAQLVSGQQPPNLQAQSQTVQQLAPKTTEPEQILEQYPQQVPVELKLVSEQLQNEENKIEVVKAKTLKHKQTSRKTNYSSSSSLHLKDLHQIHHQTSLENRYEQQKTEKKIKTEQLEKIDQGSKFSANISPIYRVLQCLQKLTTLRTAFSQFVQQLQQNNLALSHFTASFRQIMAELSKQTELQPFTLTKIEEIVLKSKQLIENQQEKDEFELLSIFLEKIGEDLKIYHQQEHAVHQMIVSEDMNETFNQKEQLVLKSIVEETITGRYKIVYTCTKCAEKRWNFEKFNIHQLPNLQSEHPPPSLHLAFKDFEKGYIVNAHCTRCQEDTLTQKCTSVLMTNKVLIVSLKNLPENQRKMSIPLELSPQDFVQLSKTPLYNASVYRLCAAIIHRDASTEDRQATICLDFDSGQYKLYTAQRCRLIAKAEMEDYLSGALLLFYELTLLQDSVGESQQLLDEQLK